jgi:hypothetical protein
MIDVVSKDENLVKEKYGGDMLNMVSEEMVESLSQISLVNSVNVFCAYFGDSKVITHIISQSLSGEKQPDESI